MAFERKVMFCNEFATSVTVAKAIEDSSLREFRFVACIEFGPGCLLVFERETDGVETEL